MRYAQLPPAPLSALSVGLIGLSLPALIIGWLGLRVLHRYRLAD
jgi:hypothetical protein